MNIRDDKGVYLDARTFIHTYLASHSTPAMPALGTFTHEPGAECPRREVGHALVEYFEAYRAVRVHRELDFMSEVVGMHVYTIPCGCET